MIAVVAIALVFKVFNEPVSIEAPAPDTVITDLKLCGSTGTPDWLPADTLDVSTSTSNVGCEKALDVADAYVRGHGEPPPGSGGSGWAAIVNGWSCDFSRYIEADLAVPGRILGTCTLLTGESIDLLTAE